MNLDGFEVFDFSVGVPKMSVTENGVTFNRHTTSSINFPEYIKVFINKKEKCVYIMPCSSVEPNAIKYYRRGKKIKSVRTNNGCFVSAMFSMYGNEAKNGFIVSGTKDDDGVLFDLKNATKL